VPVNIRVIAATHAPLEQLVRSGGFRADLYYRLNGAHFSLPPLRARADRGVMMDRLLGGRSLGTAARAQLMAHPWPGNLRELHNVLAYACSMRESGDIDIDDLPVLATNGRMHAPLHEAATPDAAHGQPAYMTSTGADTADSQDLRQRLQAAHWNVSAVARDMQLSRMTLYRRMQRAGIVPPNRA
jgi:transcriptional regulator of acetoin/glycerol metabolism